MFDEYTKAKNVEINATMVRVALGNALENSAFELWQTLDTQSKLEFVAGLEVSVLKACRVVIAAGVEHSEALGFTMWMFDHYDGVKYIWG